jgi:hypothetical protein
VSRIERAKSKVFVSAKSADYDAAKLVYDYLVAQGLDAFFSDDSLPALGNSDYRKVIDHALEESTHMVVVTTSRENVESPWVEAEWGFFINEKRSNRKSGNLVTVVSGGLKPGDLPPSLRYYEVLDCNPAGFARLVRYLLQAPHEEPAEAIQEPCPEPAAAEANEPANEPALPAAKPETIRTQDSPSRAIEVGVAALDETTRARYLRLAVVPEDMAIAPAVQRTLWGTSEGEALDTAERLIGLSLAERAGDPGAIRLHDSATRLPARALAGPGRAAVDSWCGSALDARVGAGPGAVRLADGGAAAGASRQARRGEVRGRDYRRRSAPVDQTAASLPRRRRAAHCCARWQATLGGSLA